jgi:hypothetical protein
MNIRSVPRLYRYLAIIVLATAFLFTIPLWRPQTPAERPLNVLFIGNSYTSANSLPTIFQEIAVSAGHARPAVKSAAPGGYTFQDHLTSSTTLSLIADESWDAVIMQEQSEVPAAAQTMPQVNKSFLNGFDGLHKRAKDSSPEGRVILFETWARHPDAWSNGTADPVRDGKNPSDMLRRLKAGYEAASQMVADQGGLPVEIARVGELWDINYRSASPLRLHDTDGSHPNFAGSFLAGLDVFSTIYGAAPQILGYQGPLGKNQADALISLVGSNFPRIQER